MGSELIPDRRAFERDNADRRSQPRDVVVRLEDVHKSYGRKRVLQGASVEVFRGEVLVILGGSGTGKSVTLRHMLGLEAPDGGRVFVEGQDVTDYKEEELYEVRRKFGMLFQSGALFDSMTVAENIGFPLSEHTSIEPEERLRIVREKLELVDLPGTENLMPVDLSGGMRKRVGLARAIVLNPQVILYDEPTTGLDPISREAIWRYVSELNKREGVTIFLTTQYLEEADRLADDVAIMDAGRIVAQGSPAELKASVGTDVVTVRVDGDGDARERAAAAARQIEGVADVRIIDETIVVYVPEGASAVSRIVLALSEASLTPAEVTLSRPTLDDVFLRKTGHHLEADAAVTRAATGGAR